VPYALPNAYELARERLSLLEETYDPASIRRAEALGVGDGWRCLDAGAGGGSFARWMANRGADVVAADIDVRHLEGGPFEVRPIDLRTDRIEPSAFDLVHTRIVLLHIPERDEILARLAAAVRPGGVLLIEEDEIYPVLATATGAYREAWQAFHGRMVSAGLDADWARGLPERIEALGFEGVDAELAGQFFRGGSAPARFWSLTWEQARPEMLAQGAPPEVVDAGRAALEDPAHWYHGPVRVITWGRRSH
jgi:SAM-dependent methyltransferase